MARSRQIQDLYDRLLVANLWRCCICKDEEQVQIHHIDGDNADDSWENLAVLCVRHHSRVTGNEGFGRAYKASELRLWKRKWEAKCAELDVDEGDPEDEDEEEQDEDGEEEDDETFIDQKQTILIEPGAAHEFPFDLAEGDFLAVKVTSDRPVDVFGDTREIADEWEEADPDEEPNLLMCEESCLMVRVGLLAAEDCEHVIWIHNEDERRAARVKLHFIAWEADEQDEDDDDEDGEDSEDDDE